MRPRSNTKRSSVEKKRAPDGGRFSHIYIILAAVALAAVLNLVFIINAIVPSASMEPTIAEGQAVVGWRPAYIFHEPQRGDVVIFCHDELENVNVLKRIVAVPGDVVEIKEDGVWINGILYKQCAADRETEIRSLVVPEDSYFMMGDNVNASFDSRKWENPFVLREEIKAKVIFGYFPRIYSIE